MSGKKSEERDLHLFCACTIYNCYRINEGPELP
jgi:hypothetical protein